MKILFGIIVLISLSSGLLRAQLQSDASDSLWSIVMPKADVRDIDMKEELIGDIKDSIIVNLVSNSGSYPFRVDTIYFTGGDSDAFQVASAFQPFIIDKGGGKDIELRFIPSKVGLHKAKIHVITQADTLVINITGEGIEPQIVVVNRLIDFGRVTVGEFKDTLQALTIRYIGNSSITIKETKHNKPNDIDFTTISGGGSFTLLPGETHQMDLRFTPSSIGRTSGLLEFHYDGVGSPAIVQLYAQGMGGKIVIEDDSAYAGEKRMLKLRLVNKIKPKTDDMITGFKAVVSYNPTLLTSTDLKVSKKFDLLYETIEINGRWDGTSELIGEFEVIVGLGNTDKTDLVLSEFYWLDDNMEILSYEVEKENGTFTLLGVCSEGGARFINPNSNAALMTVQPNPANSQLNIEYQLSEKGFSEIVIVNYLGETVKEIMSGEINTFGAHNIMININDIPTGQYILMMRTPTVVESRKIMVIR